MICKPYSSLSTLEFMLFKIFVFKVHLQESGYWRPNLEPQIMAWFWVVPSQIPILTQLTMRLTSIVTPWLPRMLILIRERLGHPQVPRSLIGPLTLIIFLRGHPTGMDPHHSQLVGKAFFLLFWCFKERFRNSCDGLEQWFLNFFKSRNL